MTRLRTDGLTGILMHGQSQWHEFTTDTKIAVVMRTPINSEEAITMLQIIDMDMSMEYLYRAAHISGFRYKAQPVAMPETKVE